MNNTFPIILLIGRPAAGKSEVIDYLKHQSAEGLAKLHLAPFEEIDDFIWVWQLFEDDDIRSRMGKPRVNTTPDYYFLEHDTWNFLIEKINLDFCKKLARNPDYLRDRTVIVEFARGGENGFGEAFSHLSDEILSRAVIVYIRVSYKESVRRNHKRARKGQEDSILFHSLPDAKMERYYKTNDWEQLSGGKTDGVMTIKGHRVPFAVFQNEPEKTDDPNKLGPALEETFEKLWKSTGDR